MPENNNRELLLGAFVIALTVICITAILIAWIVTR